MAAPKLRRFLRRYPALRAVIQRAYRGGLYLSARTMSKLRQDDLFLIPVNPQRIQMTINVHDPALTGSGMWHIGQVDGGDWDLGGTPVAQLGDVAEIMQAHVIQKRPITTIPQFLSNLQRISEGELIDSCTTAAEYEQRWADISTLYNAIQDSGYQTQVELGSDNPLDEIRVQIGRRGEILFEEGLHRLAIAQLLQIPQVPVLVTRRHAAWAELRDAVMRIVLQRGFIHQPFDHPDLDLLPQHYGGALSGQALYGHERWQYIQDSLPLASGTVLDIGAYFGYFDHRLEEIGFNCFAVEPDHENLAVLNCYKAMAGRAFTVWPQSIFDIERHDFDLVLALNIFHHFVRTKETYEQLLAFLQRLRCRAIYFEPDEKEAVDAYCRFTEAEFVQFVQAHTGLSRAQYLGQAQEGRGVYLLTGA